MSRPLDQIDDPVLLNDRRHEILTPPGLRTVPGRLARCFVASLCLSCTLPVQIEFIERTPLEPLPEHFAWYATTEQCSGIAGDARRVRWFTATAIFSGKERTVGNWRKPHEITLAVGFERDSFVVRHEVLHDLLDGDPDHSHRAWNACRLAPRTFGDTATGMTTRPS